MDYGQLITRSAQITWRYKFLWIFGIIMALCGQSRGGTPRLQFNYSTSMPPSGGDAPPMPEFPAFFPEPFGQVPIWVYLIVGLIAMLVFIALGIIVGAISRSAIIKSVDRIETGDTISMSTSWRDGLAKAVPVGLLHLLLALPLILFWIGAAITFFVMFWSAFEPFFNGIPNADSQEIPPEVSRMFAFFPMFFGTLCVVLCVAFIGSIIIGLFQVFGSRAIVIEDKGVLQSFSRSWQLFRRNVGSTILVALLLFVMVIIVGFVMAIPAMIVMFPIMFSMLPEMMSTGFPSMGNILLLTVVGLVMGLFFVIVHGIFQVFNEAMWTLAYREFIGNEI